MTSRTYSTLDRNALGDGLTIDDSGLIVTTNANALDFNRQVRGNLPAKSGEFSFEFYHWSNSRGSLANLVSVGVVQPDAALNQFVGKGSTGYGLRPAEGGVWNNNAKLATVEVIPERSCIGLYLYLSPGVATCTWTLNGSAIYTATLPTGKTWVPAISLGCAEAGDVSAVVNFGQQYRFDCTLSHDGWWTETKGLATLYLAHSREGFMSDPSDTPANQPYGPYVLNRSFPIRRAPQAWVHSGGGGSAAAAAFATLQLDNSAGTFNSLLRADVRDALLVFQSLDAPARGAGSLTDATTEFTARIESVTAPNASTVEIRLRDNLSRFDRPLPCRVIPPFADESSRGRIWPVGLGAQRNVQPLLIDAPTRTYGLGDAPMSNVTLVTDGGAPLDPLATPPQWTSALNGQGIALDTDPVMRLSADCSTVGQQYEIPGAEDVLAGIGAFTTWASGEPDGWDKPASPANVVANGSITQTSSYGTTSALRISSGVPYNPVGSNAYYFGYPVKSTAAYLEPGRTYRISFQLPNVLGTPDQFGVANFGLMLLTKLSDQSAYWITPHRQPIYQQLPTSIRYTFTYTVPATESAALPIYICCAASRSGIPPISPTAAIVIDDLKAELIGQYVSLPLDGMTLTQAFREILVNRAGESEGIFSTADTEAIDEATGITIGARWGLPPNILDALQEIADTFGAVIYTDAQGVIRCTQLADPEDGTPVATFDASNMDAEIKLETDDALGLTTEFGCRRNWTPFTPGDFVTDTATVPPTQREQWQGTSQIRFAASESVAGEYSHAVGAPPFDMLADETEAARAEANRIVSLYSIPRTDGRTAAPPVTPGKRRTVTFTAYYNEDGTVGTSTTCSPQDLAYGAVVSVDLVDFGLSAEQAVGILAWEIDPIARQVTITGHFR